MANHGTLKNTHIVSSITMVTPEYHFFSFFYYYVVIKFKCLFIDLCLFYSISSCTCMIIMTSYTVIYMFLNVLLIVSGSYITVHTCTISLCIEGKTKCTRGVISEQSISNVYIQWLMIILWLVYPRECS